MLKKFFTALIEEFAEIRFAASSLAFSTLLSLIPFLIIVFSVLQSVGALETLYPQMENVFIIAHAPDDHDRAGRAGV